MAPSPSAAAPMGVTALRLSSRSSLSTLRCKARRRRSVKLRRMRGMVRSLTFGGESEARTANLGDGTRGPGVWEGRSAQQCPGTDRSDPGGSSVPYQTRRCDLNEKLKGNTSCTRCAAASLRPPERTRMNVSNPLRTSSSKELGFPTRHRSPRRGRMGGGAQFRSLSKGSNR